MSGFECNRFVDLSEGEEKHLKCGICLNIFKDAVRGGCEHSFCRECVQKLVNPLPMSSEESKCPECRKPFTTRKRSQSSKTDDNLVFLGNHVFSRHLMANNLVNELKIRCDFDINGCPEVLKFSDLSAHIKECEHRFCKTCEFDVSVEEQHNCIENLKNQKNELKNKIQSMEKSSVDHRNETEMKIKKLEEQISHFRGYYPISTLLRNATELSLRLTLKPNYVICGTIKAIADCVYLKSIDIQMVIHGLVVMQLGINQMQELMCYISESFSLIGIKPSQKSHKKLNLDFSKLIDFQSVFGRHSEDKYIVLVFKGADNHLITGFVNFCKQVNTDIGCHHLTKESVEDIMEELRFKDLIFEF